ncbi:hypothetical protein QEJ31_05650 [Pigmentibacter sp. JX0631]|uniref:hypothetical protein n=1 Tax=Pigmentibacter sp. JX0631 TaxID=2976982 RepID=UPI0024683867|nr:hypothetical protein [Pigmentibacter sp. JX0631]WGL61078.1 hypothetical protein QEJ31_05650 [Pigmentibacter sp. JX0631]
MKKIIVIFLSIYIFPVFAKRMKENLCYKCYQGCLGKPKYNSLTPKEVVNFLKDGKLYIIKDYNNALAKSDLSILKSHEFLRDGTYFINNYVTFILGCKCFEKCQDSSCNTK